MRLLRVRKAEPLDSFRVRLGLTNGMTVVRDLTDVLTGPIFEPLRDETLFRDMRVDGGTIVWSVGADICPDVLIWGGPPPEMEQDPPLELRIRQQAAV